MAAAVAVGWAGKLLSKSVVSTAGTASGTGTGVSTISSVMSVCRAASTVSTVISVCVGSVTGVGSVSTGSVLFSTTTVSTDSSTTGSTGSTCEQVASRPEASSAARVRSPTSTIPESSSRGDGAAALATASCCASSG